jgi:hypothetical protein
MAGTKHRALSPRRWPIPQAASHSISPFRTTSAARTGYRLGKQTGSLWIKPTAFPLDVAHGPPRTPFTVHLKGVGGTETANISTVVFDNIYIGYACAFNSQGDVKIPLQATGDPGWHFVDLYPAIYGCDEQQPRNFLIPQLTRPTIPARTCPLPLRLRSNGEVEQFLLA